MSAPLQKLELYKDCLYDCLPIAHDHDWQGEIHINVVDERDIVRARTIIKDGAILDYQECDDGLIKVTLSQEFGSMWFVDTPATTNVQQVDLLVYPQQDAMLSKFPLTSLRNIDYTREPPLNNVYVDLPNTLAFPAPQKPL